MGTSFGGFVIDVDPKALACDCEHDSCWVQQNNPGHYDTCDCPKVEGQIALSVSEPGDWADWDSIRWAHLTAAEALERIDQVRSLIMAAGDGDAAR